MRRVQDFYMTRRPKNGTIDYWMGGDMSEEERKAAGAYACKLKEKLEIHYGEKLGDRIDRTLDELEAKEKGEGSAKVDQRMLPPLPLQTPPPSLAEGEYTRRCTRFEDEYPGLLLHNASHRVWHHTRKQHANVFCEFGGWYVEL